MLTRFGSVPRHLTFFNVTVAPLVMLESVANSELQILSRTVQESPADRSMRKAERRCLPTLTGHPLQERPPRSKFGTRLTTELDQGHVRRQTPRNASWSFVARTSVQVDLAHETASYVLHDEEILLSTGTTIPSEHVRPNVHGASEREFRHLQRG